MARTGTGHAVRGWEPRYIYQEGDMSFSSRKNRKYSSLRNSSRRAPKRSC